MESNAEFKAQLNDVPLISELKSFCDENYKKSKKSTPSPSTSPFDMIALEQLCRSHLKPVTSKSEVVTLIWFLMSVYMRENALGPSIYTEYVEDTRAPLVNTGKLPRNDLDSISYKNKPL